MMAFWVIFAVIVDDLMRVTLTVIKGKEIRYSGFARG
jgi:hypothetical protein